VKIFSVLPARGTSQMLVQTGPCKHSGTIGRGQEVGEEQ